jgi:hypothetical protein
MGIWCSEYLSFDTTEAKQLESELCATFHGVLKWAFLSTDAGFLCPEKRIFIHGKTTPRSEYDKHGRMTLYNECWKPLAIHATPLVLLTSLKPGLDSHFVREAIEFKRLNPYWPLTIKMVLPYDDKDKYLRCGIFDSAQKIQDFNRLYEAITKEVANLEEVVIPVPLDNDWCRKNSPSEVDVDLLNKIKGERKLSQTVESLELGLRLRATGEYIAAFSDLLVACYDPPYEHGRSDPENVFDYSVGSVVEAKRSGLSWELIALTNNFTWADNGPVLQIRFERNKCKSGLVQPSQNPDQRLRFLHPYETKPKANFAPVQSQLIEAAWQAAGDSIFRRILMLQDEFNTLPENPKERTEVSRMFPMATVESSAIARKMLQGLGKAASIRRRAADVSIALTKKREGMLKRLVILIGFAAICLGCYEHWHSQNHDTLLDNWIKLLLLFGVVGCVSAAAFTYSLYARSKKEEKRFDYRAIGEALRIQIYWAISGLERSVASDYLQRHRDELDWIRYIVSGASFPFRRWKLHFLDLNRSDQWCMLEGVRQAWVQVQEEYFEKNVKKLEAKHHFWHKMAWSFAFAGLIQPVFMLGQHLSEWLHLEGVKAALWYMQLAVGSVGLPSVVTWAFGRNEQESHVDHQQVQGTYEVTLLQWLHKRLDVIGVGLFISGILGLLYTLLPKLPGVGEYLPGEHDWWIILNGVILLIGALSLAWTERNFHTEEHRNFSSMRMLYHSANLRLQDILIQMSPLKDDQTLRNTDWERLRLEAQDILYNLGCEHLSENADWLIYHRARPLEPFMAG